MEILIYLIDDQQYGIPLSQVRSASLAVETKPLPNAPDYILGAINVRGEIIPVINMRKILKLPCQELKVSDQFILCEIGNKSMALWVDNIIKIKNYKEDEFILADEILPPMKGLRHLIKENDQMILLYDHELAI